MDSLFAGLISGLSQTIIGHPLDTLKVWKQNNNSLKPTIKNLYIGIKYPLIQNPFICGSGFYVNDFFLKKTKNIYVSSSIAGFINSIVLTPLDYYKIKRQQQLPTNFLHCYKNFSIVLLRGIPSNLFYFSTYDILRKKDISTEIAGGCAGVSSWLFTYPIDTLKTRMQTDVHLSLYNAYKMSGLFHGITYCLVRAFFVNSIGFVVYESTREHTIKYMNNH